MTPELARPASDSSGLTSYQEFPPPSADILARHLRNIEIIAMETQRSVQEVAPLYIETMALFKTQAHIEDYLPILVSKRVKAIFRRR